MSPTPARIAAFCCLTLIVATFAVYGSVLRHPFVHYDDQDYVTENSHVHQGLRWNAISWALTSTEDDNWHPLTWISHELDYELYGLKPGGHHLTSLALHILNALLLFWLLNRATGKIGRSFLVAALFALHPLNVESVAWVAERKNVLSTFFCLLTLASYGWYAVRPNLSRYSLVALLFVLGLASKPMVITIPFVLLLLDFWPLERIASGRSAPDGSSRKKRKAQLRDSPPLALSKVTHRSFPQLVSEKLPLLLLCMGSAVITVIAQQASGLRTLERFSLGLRLENALDAYAGYLWHTLWPLDLAVFYPHPGATLPLWQLAIAVVCIVLTTSLTLHYRVSRKYLLAGWLWYLGTLIPVIGLIQVGDQAMADRYVYIPLIGIFVMAVWAASDWADQLAVGLRTRAALCAAILLALGFQTRRQITYWDSDLDLWTHALQVTKANATAEESISKALLVDGRAEEALPGLKKAALLQPNDPNKFANLGAALFMTGRVKDAIPQYQAAIHVARDVTIQARCYDTLATLYDELGDYAEVRDSYQQALTVAPRMRDELVRVLAQNVESDPSAPRYLQLGILLEEAGYASRAQAAYQQAFVLDPSLKIVKPNLSSTEGPGR